MIGQPRGNARLVKIVITGQSCHNICLLEGGKTYRTFLSYTLVHRHRAEGFVGFLLCGGLCLRNGLVQPQEHLVVFGRDLSREQVVDLPVCQAAGQLGVGEVPATAVPAVVPMPPLAPAPAVAPLLTRMAMDMGSVSDL